MMRKGMICLLAGCMLFLSACLADNAADFDADEEDIFTEASNEDEDDVKETAPDSTPAQEAADASATDTKDETDANDETVTDEADAPAEDEDAQGQAEADESQWDEIMFYTVPDLDLNDVRLGDIISGNKVTLVNYWGTFCGPCIREMPDLAKLEKEYKDQGFEVIGLTCDIAYPDGTNDPGAIDDALSIMDDTGVEYPVLIATDEVNRYINTDVVPISFFVDQNGNRLSDVITGSQDGATWEKYITSLL